MVHSVLIHPAETANMGPTWMLGFVSLAAGSRLSSCITKSGGCDLCLVDARPLETRAPKLSPRSQHLEVFTHVPGFEPDDSSFPAPTS